MIPDALSLLLILIIAFLFSGALAPFEALGWWAGWFGRQKEDIAKTAEPVQKPSQAKHFVIFLTGIHSVSEASFARREIALLEQLRKRMPDAMILELFPYSVTNQALTGQRFFAWFWRLALKLKLSRLAFAGFIINMRNIWQVAVSADRRYGPIYNQGTAESMALTLRRHGYTFHSGTPITLIGYSGGGQIAIGAAPYLKEIIQAPITIISMGGIMCSDPGLGAIDRLYHLYGRRDRVQRLGFLLFPGRWPLLPYSAWNQALHDGHIQLVDMGPVDHTGKDGYLDSQQKLPDGRSYLEQTVATITAIIEEKSVSSALWFGRS
ncbi:MAG: hypothetical protein KC422_24685 [Trueperaceae bacterium]|nr:hypothetical protein [Trueperaceae bacterium]